MPKILTIFWFVTICGIHFVSVQNPITRCGETHNTVTGGVFHKPFDPVLEKERCAWIIGVDGAVGYEINILLLGRPTNLPESNQNLVFTGFRHGATNETELPGGPVQQNVLLPSTVGKFVVPDSNILVVTFSSPDTVAEPGFGFILEYEAIFNGNISLISSSSSHQVFNSPLFEFNYPPAGGNYTDLELAAFIFPTGDNLYGNLNHVWFDTSLDNVTCSDTIYFYQFEKRRLEDGSIRMWHEYQRVCGETLAQHTSKDDLVLALFQSDGARTFPGFTFWYNAC